MKGKKTGGRKEGTPNKTTKEIKLLMTQLIADFADDFYTRLGILDTLSLFFLYAMHPKT